MSESTHYRQRWLGMIFICTSLLIISLDNTVLNVALPAISRDLGATASELQWIVDAYILVFAALLLTTGSIGDRLGRKRALQVGVAWFGVFSLMAALSTSTEMLLAARALLGIGGALIMPATLSLISAMFRDPRERAQAIGIWAGVFGLGIGVGPLVGGWLIERYSWNAVFFVNLPVVVVALMGGRLFVPESKDASAPPPDIPGVIFSFGGLLALVYAIIEAGVSGWGASHVLAGFAVSAVLLVLFFWWENRTETPMLPVYLFRNMSFTGANVAMTLMMFGMFGALFFLSQYFQSVKGYSAFEAGLRMFPMSAILMISAGLSARLTARFGAKVVVGVGFLIAASGMLFLSQTVTPESSYPTVLLGLGILGVGMGSAMSPATDSIMGAVPISKAGVGSAMNDTTRQVGGALGVAVLGTLMNDTYLDKVSQLESLAPPQVYEVVRSSIQGAHMVAAQIGGQTSEMLVSVANDAFVSGMTDGMFAAAFVMGAAALFTFLVLPREPHCLEDECGDEVDHITYEPVEAVPAPGD